MRYLIGLLALGLHWTAHASQVIPLGINIHQFAQTAAQPELVYAIGDGRLFRSDDRGQTWKALRIPERIGTARVNIDPKDARHLLVLARHEDSGKPAGLQESFDAGLHWVQRSPLKFSEPDGSAGGKFFPNHLVIPADRQGSDWWALDERWFRSSDAGRTWRRHPDGRLAASAVQGRSLSYSLDNTVLWRSGPAGSPWEKVHEFQSPRSNLIALSDDELVVRDGQGNWLQSNDRGSTWAPARNGFQSLNQQPPGPPVAKPAAALGDGETSCEVRASPAATGTLVASCVWGNGGAYPSLTCVHVSTDAGKSWTPPRAPGSPSGRHCLAPGMPGTWTASAWLLDVADPRRMLVAWQGGGFYRSDDGGATWQATGAELLYRKGRENAGTLVLDGPARPARKEREPVKPIR